MPKCYTCGRYFKTQNGLKSHLAMVKRTGSHYPKKKRFTKRYYKRNRRY